MDFVKPEYEIVYNKLSTNNKLIKYLTELGVLITTDDYYNTYGTKSKIDPKIYVAKYNKTILKNIASFFLENENQIENLSITQLASSKKAKELRQELKTVLGFEDGDTLPISVFREIFYSYKNSYIDNFFQNNWRSFLPECDEEQLDNNDFARTFVDAITKEFDKIDEIITNTKQFRNYEEVPDKYINHMSQLLGLEQKDFYIPEDQLPEFKVLAENIIEIYKTKGEYATFDLLFKLFGFNINITEYYFDRRMYFAKNDENTETISLDKNSYKFYLTKNNPTLNSMDNFELNEIVTDKDMTERYSCREFNDLVAKYGLECVLGYDDYYTENYTLKDGSETEYSKSLKYTGNVYKYFKTNMVTIRPSTIGNTKNLTSSNLMTIKSFLKFLVPYFWEVNLNVNPTFDMDDEKFVVNGHRRTHDEDGKQIFDEGFRMLDSETWIYKDDSLIDKLRKSSLSNYDKNQIEATLSIEEERLNEIKKDFLLQYEFCDDYVVLHDNDIVFTVDEFTMDYGNDLVGLTKQLTEAYKKKNNITLLSSSDKEKIKKEVELLKKKYTRLKSFNNNKAYYVKDIKKEDDTINERNVYYNSIGERNGDRTHVEDDDSITNYNVIMEPICKKLITINSTKYWGKVYDENSNTKKLPVYPTWVEDYKPIEGNETKERYFSPCRRELLGETHLYIPKYADYKEADLIEQWKRLQEEDLELCGIEGNTLKKNYLDTNECREITWVASGTDIQKSINCKQIKYNKANETKDFYAKERKEVPNMTWNLTSYKLIYSKMDLLKKENKIWNILLIDAKELSEEYNINNLSDITDDFLTLVKGKVTSKKYNIIINNLKEIKELQNNILLEDFVKTHKVINYDYVRDELHCIAAPDFKAASADYWFNDDLFNNLYFQNSYYIDCNNGNSIKVYKLTVNKNSVCNKFYFVDKTDLDTKASFEINSVDSLVYVDSENEINDTHSLLIKDGKTYCVVKKDNVLTYTQINPGVIILDQSTKKKYMAMIGTTNCIQARNDNSSYVSLNPSLNSLNKGTGFTCKIGTNKPYSIYQYKSSQIKQGQLIYMPETGKLYEIMFNDIYYHDYKKNEVSRYFLTDYTFVKATKKESTRYKHYWKLKDNGAEKIVFGIRPVELFGKIEKINGEYKLFTADENYKGVCEQDDNDNYILNNYERIAEWKVLDGCDTTYLKDNSISRPVKEITDRVFEEALVGKNSNKKIVENILGELIGDKRVLTGIALRKDKDLS